VSSEKSSDALWNFSACKFIKKFRAHFHDLCVQKRSCFPWSSDIFFEFCAFKVNRKCFGRIFTIYASKNEEFCCEWDACWKFSACKIYKNISGCIFTIYASKNKAVYREVQTDFGRFLHGRIFTIFASKLKLFPAKFRCNLEIFALWGLRRKFCAFSWFLRSKTKLFPVKFKRIFEVLRLQGLQKSSGRIFTICASKNEAVSCEVQTHFGSSLSASFAENVLGAFSQFMRPKTKLFAVKFRYILDVFTLRGLYKKFWAHYHHFCVQKRSCLLLISDAFWKFSACKVYKEISGRIFTIYMSKNEAVVREVQTHFGSSCLQVLQKKLWAHFHDWCVQTRSCLLWSSDAFWKFSLCQVYEQSFGRIFTIYASKSEAVYRATQTHFRSYLPLRFTEKVLDEFSRFMRLKTKLFAVKFRHIFEVFSVQALEKSYGCICSIFASKNEAVCCWVQTHFRSFRILRFMKKFWVHFHDLCLQTRSCLLWSSDAFWKLSPCKLYEKVLGSFSRCTRPKT